MDKRSMEAAKACKENMTQEEKSFYDEKLQQAISAVRQAQQAEPAWLAELRKEVAYKKGTAGYDSGVSAESVAKLLEMLEGKQQAEPVAPGLYAILYRDNWDGEGDVYHLLAEYKDGKWLNDVSGKELLQYEGDAILRVWPLTDDNAQPPAVAVPSVADVARAIWSIRREEEDRCDMELEDIPLYHSVWSEAEAVSAMLAAAPQAASSAPDVASKQALQYRWLLENCIQEDENGWAVLHFETCRQLKTHPQIVEWMDSDIEVAAAQKGGAA